MIPIRDENPSGTFPFVTLLIMVANIGIFVLHASLGEARREGIYESFGLVPADAWWDAGRGVAVNLKALVPFVSAMFPALEAE